MQAQGSAGLIFPYSPEKMSNFGLKKLYGLMRSRYPVCPKGGLGHLVSVDCL